MRSVCFVDRIELEFIGNVLQGAVTFGDVDNDGESELVVGGINGDLFVYKGDKLWQSITGLGMITCVAVGDVMNCGSNAVVVISGDGWCHIYLCLNSSHNENGAKLELVHNQRIPANAKVVVLGDALGNGQTDMVLGLTDRVVRIYRWVQSASAGNLLCLSKCESANQIGSVCLCKTPDGSPYVLVSQPGATYMTISHRDDGETQVDYHVVSSVRAAGTTVSSQLVGDIGPDHTHALITLNGYIMLIKNNQLLWSKNVEEQVFSSSKARVCGTKDEELVACSWSGRTYIVDLEGHTVCFDLGQPVQAFTSGIYTSMSTTAFVYLTFNNKVYVYHDIKVENLVCSSLYSFQKEDDQLSRFSKAELKKLTEYCLYSPNAPKPTEKATKLSTD